MTKQERITKIADLYSQGFGRPTIMEMVEGSTEWEVRKTIRDLRKGKLDVAPEIKEAVQRNKRMTGQEIVSQLRPIKVEVPRNRKVQTTPNKQAETVVFVGDTHGQFVDQRALDITCQIIEDIRPDMLVHLGDLGDFYSVSFHDKDPNRKTLLQDDLEAAGKVLGQLDQTVSSNTPKKLFEGNHETRLIRYLWRTAPALASLPHLKMEVLLDLDNLGWEYITKDQEIFPEFIAKHGNFVSSKSAYTARKEMERSWTGGISGHVHRLGISSYTPRRNYIRAMQPAMWIENGCLCSMDAEYISGGNPDWQQGFTVIRNTDGILVPEQIHIINGRASFGGKLYRG